MKILFYQWHSFMNKGIEKALQKLGVEYDVLFYQQKDWENDTEFQYVFMDAIQQNYDKVNAGLGKLKSLPASFFERKSAAQGPYDLVLSVNFSSNISATCQKCGIRYVSWIYDSPIHIRNLDPMKNSCNQIYMFDRGMVEEYAKLGIKASHLPLAVDPEIFSAKKMGQYSSQVALLGNLYQTDYALFTSPLEEYDRGYLEGIVNAQMKVYGGYMIPELVTDDLLKRLNARYAQVDSKGFQMGRRELEFMLASEVTGRERYMIAALLSKHFNFALYSGSKDDRLSSVKKHDYVDYYSVMPHVFASSDINLNISLRTIRTGIPLRVVDVLGCGGFLISNYQEELPEYFVVGEECEVYENLEDLYAKVQFYLQHDDIRSAIAQNGLARVRQEFTFEQRLGTLLSS